MASLDSSSEAARDAAIRDLLARTPPAPRDPLRARIMQATKGAEALLAALDFAQPARKRA